MKKYIKFLALIVLIFSLIYVCAIDSIPDSMILFQGENLKVNTIFGLDLKLVEGQYEAVQTASSSVRSLDEVGEVNDFEEIEEEVNQSSNVQDDNNQVIGSKKYSLNLFNAIKVKDVTVNVIPKTSVVLLGDVVGLKLYTSGVLVVGMSEIEGENNNKYKPYKDSGIEEGDTIVSVDEKTVTCTSDLIKYVNQSNGEKIEIKYVRDEEEYVSNIEPVKSKNADYKLGLWVRDSTAGVGTVTFYDPQTQMFGALGHGIVDIDTEKLINIRSGDFVTTKILSIVKGTRGKPGKIQGSVESGKTIGEIYKNTSIGIYGKLTNLSALSIDTSKLVEVANRDEIKEGDAKMICTLDDGVRKEYDIKIQSIYLNNNYNNKSMLIEVTDDELIEKTGGIIQGMSGSPIIQNGKFVGAVTNVLVNSPTKGYAIFADMMIKEMNSVD